MAGIRREPASIGLLLHRCLEKNVTRRLRDIGDARIEIEDALATTVGKEPASAAAGRRPPAARAWKAKTALAIAVLGIAAGSAYVVLRLHTEIASPAKDISFMQLPDQAGPETFPSLSPNGRSFLYAGGVFGNEDIYLPARRRQESHQPRQLLERSGLWN